MAAQMQSLKPGSAIGIGGSVQLGRMLAMAAARLFYWTIILGPDEYCPAEQVASNHITAAYDDTSALETLAALCDVVIYEFENVPIETARFLQQKDLSFRRREHWRWRRTGCSRRLFSTIAGLPRRNSRPWTTRNSWSRRSTPLAAAAC